MPGKKLEKHTSSTLHGTVGKVNANDTILEKIQPKFTNKTNTYKLPKRYINHPCPSQYPSIFAKNSGIWSGKQKIKSLSLGCHFVLIIKEPFLRLTIELTSAPPN